MNDVEHDADWLPEVTVTSTRTVYPTVAPLLEACQVPGTILSLDALQVLAYSLLLTGQREVRLGAGPEWQQAMRLAGEVGATLPAHDAGRDQVTPYVEGGFLGTSSAPGLLVFASPYIQAVLAALFLTAHPGHVTGLVPQLGTSAAARMAVATALRIDNCLGAAEVYARLVAVLSGAMPLTAAAHAAALSLAIGDPAPGVDAAEARELVGRLALVLADRVTAAGGPALGAAGLRDAMAALESAQGSAVEDHLLTARRVGAWIAEAESPVQNVAVLASQGTIRHNIVGMAAGPLGVAERAAARREVERALAEGRSGCPAGWTTCPAGSATSKRSAISPSR